jgi:hypothetical protein
MAAIKKARTTAGLPKKEEARNANKRHKERKVRRANVDLALDTADKTFEDLTKPEKDKLLKLLLIKAEFIKPS